MDLKRWFYVVFVFAFICVSSGCNLHNRQTPKEQKFSEMFSNIPMAGFLKVVNLNNPDDISTKAIGVENISNVEIEIPLISDQLYVFSETEQKWVAVPEQMTFDEPFRLYPEEDIERGQMKSWVFFIDPDLSKFEKPITVRAIVIGEIIENDLNSGKKVGGYIDLEFK